MEVAPLFVMVGRSKRRTPGRWSGPGSVPPLSESLVQLASSGMASPPFRSEVEVIGDVAGAVVVAVTAGGSGASMAEPVAIPAASAEPATAAARTMTAAAVLTLAAGDPGFLTAPGCTADVDIASPLDCPIE